MAADVIAGLAVRDRPVLGTAIVGVFGLQVATTGWNEKRLRRRRPPVSRHPHPPASHATYYPGAEGMSLKLLVDPRRPTRSSAPRASGATGVDKRIDVIATAMTGGLTASALADLELAYAPQFASAKDPVNMLGYIADNLRTGRERARSSGTSSRTPSADGAVLVDVRTQAEHEAGAIPGAPAHPASTSCASGSTRSRPGRSSCTARSAMRGHTAARILAQHGGATCATSTAATAPGWPARARARRR